MSNEKPIKTNILQPSKRTLYQEFILWIAMPHEEKMKLGIEWQKDFAEYYKVREETLSKWKQRVDFEDRVDEIIKVWSNEKTPAVVHSIYRSALKGNAMSQMLWLQYFKKFNPKQNAEEENKKVVLAVSDIRYSIEQLPENLKQKHYGYLRELAEDLIAVRNIGDIEDDRWNARPALAISNETDNDAQDIRDIEHKDALAKGHTTSVCADMVGQVSESDNQSASRWW